jgi:hypothetical protein
MNSETKSDRILVFCSFINNTKMYNEYTYNHNSNKTEEETNKSKSCIVFNTLIIMESIT